MGRIEKCEVKSALNGSIWENIVLKKGNCGMWGEKLKLKGILYNKRSAISKLYDPFKKY